MLYRKSYDDLIKWKRERNENHISECLSIRGPRQVGKTFLVREFGHKEYKTFIEINFANSPSYKDLFDGDLSADRLYQFFKLSFSNLKFVEGNTLIFLDEIQKCSNARTALKIMASDFRYDVITSGSLLGLSYSQDDDKDISEPKLLPVGFEKIYILNSLDFEEFLLAIGVSSENINILKDYANKKEPLNSSILKKYEEIYRQYLVLGGMPEVIQNFVNYKDYRKAFEIQDRIITNYNDDIAIHAKGAEKIKVRRCFDSLPSQLGKEFKKFQYSLVESGQTSKKYGGSVKWLEDSQIVKICRNVKQPFIPLRGNEIYNEYKMYLHDTGLLLALYGLEARKGILFNTLKGNGKGGIYENAVAEILYKKGLNINYYHPSDNQEIEFIIEKDNEVLPIEVKASNGPSISLNRFIDTYKPPIAYKVINGNLGYVDKKISIPHFLLPFVL